MQPNFVRNWGGEGGLYETRLGRARWRRNNPFATPRARRGSLRLQLRRHAGRTALRHYAVPPSTPTAGSVSGRRRRCVATPAAVGCARRCDEDASTPSGLVPARADLVVLSGNPLLADVDRDSRGGDLADGREVYRAAAAAERPTTPLEAAPITSSTMNRFEPFRCGPCILDRRAASVSFRYDSGSPLGWGRPSGLSIIPVIPC